MNCKFILAVISERNRRDGRRLPDEEDLMNRKVWMGAAVLVAAVWTAGCGSAPAGTKAAAGDGKIPVAVSFDAMKEFTQAVGGDKVKISVIIPDGTEPHEFDPKPQDLKSISEAKVFVYSGLGMEAWADKAVKAAAKDNLITVEASKGADPIQLTDPEEIEEHGAYDPHLWLSLKGAELEAANIRDGLIQASPENKQYFEDNYNKFKNELDALWKEYDGKFKTAKSHTIVTGHAAFGYFGRDFGLTQKSVEDTFASGEPTPAKLAELAEFVKKNHVKTVFTEDQVSPAVSETLAKEGGADTKQIYTMESSDKGLTYLDRMKKNLENVYEALK